MLLPLFIDTDSFEGEVATWSEVGLNGTRKEEWVGHFEEGYAVGDDVEFKGYDTGHFDRAAEC